MKTAIVTGASGNLGQAVVKKFIAEGYYVIGTVIPNEPQKPLFPATNFEAVALDLLNEEKTGDFIQSVINKYGQVDIAVLTVGGFTLGNIKDSNAAAIRKQYQLNFETAYNLARPVFIQLLKQGQGKIFFIGAKPGLHSSFSKNMVAYGLAKSLIFRLADLMNDEAAGTAVSASVIVPGTIDTPQNRMAMPGSDFTKWKTPESLADIIHLHCTSTVQLPKETVIEVF